MSDDERCTLCEPVPHPNCEVYTVMTITNLVEVQSGKVPVCLEHFEAIEQTIGDVQ